jgi:hypothetical protein
MVSSDAVRFRFIEKTIVIGLPSSDTARCVTPKQLLSVAPPLTKFDFDL